MDTTVRLTVPVSTDTTTVTIALAGVVALCVSVILLLLSLIAALCYKLTRAKEKHDVPKPKALPVNENEAYGKVNNTQGNTYNNETYLRSEARARSPEYIEMF